MIEDRFLGKVTIEITYTVLATQKRQSLQVQL